MARACGHDPVHLFAMGLDLGLDLLIGGSGRHRGSKGQGSGIGQIGAANLSLAGGLF